MSTQPRLVWPVGALLGEGPVWCADEAALRFVDIQGGKLHRFDPATGARETRDVGGMPSFIVPAADGGYLVGSGHRLRRFDGAALGEILATIDMPAHNRTNDATVDAAGRLWFGTMDNEENLPSGALHCLDQGTIRTSEWNAVVTNGPAVSCDGQALYHVDWGNARSGGFRWRAASSPPRAKSSSGSTRPTAFPMAWWSTAKTASGWRCGTAGACGAMRPTAPCCSTSTCPVPASPSWPSAELTS